MNYKFTILLLALFSSLCCYSQQWVLDEIADERESSVAVTYFDIGVSIILVAFIWGGYKLCKVLKSLDYKKYIKIRKVVIIVCIIITAIIPITILTYFDLKKGRLEKEAYTSFNNIINNADSYIELNNGGYATFSEIQPYDNKVPGNLIQHTLVYETILDRGVSPYEGVYRCFDIQFDGNQVIFAKYAKNKGFSSDTEPAIYHGWIRPYRIRYYSQQNINPDRDLYSVYPNFLQNFIWEHRSHRSYDIIDEFFRRNLNEYYKIDHLPYKDGAAMWRDNKLYYEHDIAQRCSFEYKTINYGNFDIT